MKTLIRFITHNAAGGSESSDKLVDAATISIGRATDQVLHIRDRRVGLQHARIEEKAGSVLIYSSAPGGVTVNGRSRREAELRVGDSIEIGSNIIRIIEPPPHVAFAMSFELRPDAEQEHFDSDWHEAASGIGGFSIRRLSWMLLAAVLLVSLLLPGLSLVSPELAGVMRSAPLPDDRLWLAGPLHSAHTAIADDCQVCHQAPFEPVTDAACLACHRTGRHVAADGHGVLGEQRCAACHLEHNEPPQLVNRHQDLCADCHADLPDDVALESAADFGLAHPEFRVSLLQPGPTAASDWQPVRWPMPEAQGREQSRLKFDHAVHLDPAGILTPEGRRVIDCQACHVAEPGGAGMQPITMDEHCSGCHTLAFDPDDPARRVPHGDPAAVVQALVEYYSARLLGADTDTVERRIRRPGQALTRADRDRAAAEARVQALNVAEDLFERRACANCHEVSKIDGDIPWHVEPVRLTRNFFPHANFSHAAHQTDLTSCDSCHFASASGQATDVLIPDLASCRDCHGSAVSRHASGQQLPSTCVMCHSFHFDGKGDYP